MDSLTMGPDEIEAGSFSIIAAEASDHGRPEPEWQVLRRVIHTSADFDYVKSLLFSPDAVKKGVAALQDGAAIVTDSTMTLSGINKPRLASFGCKVSCHVADPDVAKLAKEEGITRSVAAMRKAAADRANRIFVIGNAPTALFELLRLIASGYVLPELIVALPVGFVGAAESKRILAGGNHGVPFITNIGRKGGSNIAASVVNALAIQAGEIMEL
ncbi:MAG TPA: precorrin-8X methylmutase [Geobacteraceae bacterium]|nr:precorrin-8X methylmutase [Geobacteraceae bacterium]